MKKKVKNEPAFPLLLAEEISEASVRVKGQCEMKKYEYGEGWTINEIGPKQSGKGTYVYLKSYSQYINREPSNSIELN